MRGTDTGLALLGEAEFAVAAMVRAGVPEDEALTIIVNTARDDHGCTDGMVPADDMQVTLRICESCAAKIHPDIRVGLLVPGADIPLCRQH